MNQYPDPVLLFRWNVRVGVANWRWSVRVCSLGKEIFKRGLSSPSGEFRRNLLEWSEVGILQIVLPIKFICSFPTSFTSGVCSAALCGSFSSFLLGHRGFGFGFGFCGLPPSSSSSRSGFSVISWLIMSTNSRRVNWRSLIACWSWGVITNCWVRLGC